MKASLRSITRSFAIDRGNWSVTSLIQPEVYKVALLIFYGKISVYLKAMAKPRPQHWRERFA